MNAKTLKIGLVAALAIVISATTAFAWRGGGWGGCGGYGGGPGYGMMGYGMMGGYGPGAAQIAPEKQEAYQKLYQEYFDKTAQVRADLSAKQAELNALSYAPNADQAKVAELAKAVGELHAKLITEQSAFRTKAAKEIGNVTAAPGFCPGYGGRAGFGGCPYVN